MQSEQKSLAMRWAPIATKILAIAATILFVLAAIIGTPSTAIAQNLQPVSVIGFPGSGNWPIWVAQEKGYFTRAGIEVTFTPTPNSVFQLTNLIEGKFDIGMTAFDNVVAYMEGQGEFPVSTQPDLFVFMGGIPSMLALTVPAEIKTYQDLKGKTLAVDAITTGFAFILFDLLKHNGLDPDSYRIESAGGTLARWQGLRDRKYAGALLSTPFDLIAKANGFSVLQYVIDAYGHYQDPAATTRRSWAAANEKKLDAYIKSYVAAVEWIRDPSNKDEAIAILRKYLTQLTPELAVPTHAALTSSKGIAPKARLDVAGIHKMLELRSEYGKPKKILTDPSRYYDLKYYEAALQ